MDEIFCEYCDRWVGGEEIECRSLDFDGSSELKDFVEQVKRGEVLKLNELSPRPEGSGTFLQLETSGCNTCEALNFLSLYKVKISYDKEGGTECEI